jgi:Fic family protein
MSPPTFIHHDLSLISPAFDSPLVDVLTALEHLRRLEIRGTTPTPIFFQLKRIFHMVESLASARIEGNHTTLTEYVESKLFVGTTSTSDQLREMENIEEAMAYIEEHFHAGSTVTEHLIRELHVLTVRNLVREGDATPGAYRRSNVWIAKSPHLPPDPIKIPEYMDELVRFLNEDHGAKYDLIKVAIAHHRFGWIHPFTNGNGRVVRLLTYALLIKYGFNVSVSGRVLNPTAVFCNDREQYYTMLSAADSGTKENVERWCEYVLRGILAEVEKVDRLTDYSYLQERVLGPAIVVAKQREHLTDMEAAILRIAIRKGISKAADYASAMPRMNSAQRTYQIRKLVERNMLMPIASGARQYTIGFSNNVLLRGIIQALAEEGFIPTPLNDHRQTGTDKPVM